MERPELEILTLSIQPAEDGGIEPVLNFNTELMMAIGLTDREVENHLDTELVQKAIINIIKPFVKKLNDFQKSMRDE